jgi:peptidoglycan/LPS O-acetylase OafA/YrhL
VSISPHLDNNFNLLRLVAASSVIFSHAYDITSGLHDPLSARIGYSAGWVAVSAFFSMSGYLIYKSALRTPSAADYMSARCLRILPGLWAMLIITTLALSSNSVLSLADYLGMSETWEYIFGNAIMYRPRYELPGVFLGNPLVGVINGSLWTLRFEFTCYILVIALSVSGVFSRERWFRLFAVVAVATYMAFIAHAPGLGVSARHVLCSLPRWHAGFVGDALRRVSGRSSPIADPTVPACPHCGDCGHLLQDCIRTNTLA